MATTYTLAEIISKTKDLKRRDEKVKWLKENNCLALRTILAVMYDKENFKLNIPNEAPPYKKSLSRESYGALYRAAERTLQYFIVGGAGDNLPKIRREALFIQMMESIDEKDAELMELVIKQEPLTYLPYDVINESLNFTLTDPKQRKK